VTDDRMPGRIWWRAVRYGLRAEEDGKTSEDGSGGRVMGDRGKRDRAGDGIETLTGQRG
jgi:hypothetical protein